MGIKAIRFLLGERTFIKPQWEKISGKALEKSTIGDIAVLSERLVQHAQEQGIEAPELLRKVGPFIEANPCVASLPLADLSAAFVEKPTQSLHRRTSQLLGFEWDSSLQRVLSSCQELLELTSNPVAMFTRLGQASDVLQHPRMAKNIENAELSKNIFDVVSELPYNRREKAVKDITAKFMDTFTPEMEAAAGPKMPNEAIDSFLSSAKTIAEGNTGNQSAQQAKRAAKPDEAEKALEEFGKMFEQGLKELDNFFGGLFGGK